MSDWIYIEWWKKKTKNGILGKKYLMGKGRGNVKKEEE